jgi:hypothetical protein
MGTNCPAAPAISGESSRSKLQDRKIVMDAVTASPPMGCVVNWGGCWYRVAAIEYICLIVLNLGTIARPNGPRLILSAGVPDDAATL